MLGFIANKVQGSDNLTHSYGSFYELKAKDIDNNDVCFCFCFLFFVFCFLFFCFCFYFLLYFVFVFVLVDYHTTYSSPFFQVDFSDFKGKVVLVVNVASK